ncbi:MAG TPA: UvrB/UvrC motif-containing protein, partial [Burkholderiales bacterium]|nr:UvrB/UvrC motif-containing protein [Burkholderiales bacterium]
EEQARYEAMTEKEIGREIKRLEKQMLDHARNLEFEQAARVRDQLADVRKKVFGVAVEEEPAPRQASG